MLLGSLDRSVLYERGQGLPKDDKKTVELAQKACDGGVANGCNNLGYFYEAGQAVAYRNYSPSSEPSDPLVRC